MYTLQDKNRLDILSEIFGLRRYLIICGWGDYYSKELIEEGVNLVYECEKVCMEDRRYSAARVLVRKIEVYLGKLESFDYIIMVNKFIRVVKDKTVREYMKEILDIDIEKYNRE